MSSKRYLDWWAVNPHSLLPSPKQPRIYSVSMQICLFLEPFLSPRDSPDSGIKPRSPVLQADSLSFEPPREAHLYERNHVICDFLVTGFCYLSLYLPGSSMSYHESTFHLFLFLCMPFLYKCTLFIFISSGTFELFHIFWLL